MTDLVLQNATKQKMTAYAQSPTHALLLTGPAGSGKYTLAATMIEQALQLTPGAHTTHPYVRIVQVEPDKQSISIETIRELEHFLSRKVPTTALYNRAVLIEDAHKLTPEAQNALLKLLEEPPEGTVLILTATQPQAILPTLRSRSQLLAVGAPEHTALQAYFDHQGKSAAEINQALAVSGGLPGLMHALLNDTAHPLLNATEQARVLLKATAYERLLLVDALSKDKALTADTLYILQQMAHVSLQTATGPAAKRWQRILSAAYAASQALQQSSSVKLTLTDLMLSL